MVSEDITMTDWRDDARVQLQELHRMLTSPTLVSEVPLYVLETLVEETPHLICSEINPDDVHDMVVGAFRASGDAGCGTRQA